MQKLPSLLTIPLLFILVQHHVAAADTPIDFATDILPLLAEHCFDCHGNEKPKGKLSLMSKAGAFASLKSDDPVILPGHSNKSLLYARITTSDPDDVMPPKGEKLTAAQIALIKRWIDAGAQWPDNLKHWAYEKPRANDIPINQHPIDYFVDKKLALTSLTTAQAAERNTLLRRVTFDLTGLPPTVAEQTAFLSDQAPDAYERLVDRLIASPQFGVRWARPWLDLARYADSHGFQRDDLRDLWPYRDWVVDAINSDMPFTQFTIEQLAGDLLPNATMSQRIATGFNRGTPCNVEAGTDPEENRVNQVFDRVNTFGAVWLGTTLECAQCHNHKYDPFSNSEYFQIYACFNQTALEADRQNPNVPGSIKFKGPFYEIGSDEQIALRKKLTAEKENLEKQLKDREKALAKDREAFIKRLIASQEKSTTEQVLTITKFESENGSNHQILPDGSVLVTDANTPSTDTYTITVTSNLQQITGIKLEALTDPSLPGKGPGRGDAERPNFVLNQFIVYPSSAEGNGPAITFSRANASFSQTNFPVGSLLKVTEPSARVGWSIFPQFHQDHWAVFENDAPIATGDKSVFTIKLVQIYGGGRTIGRLRFSALNGPSSGLIIPDNIREIIAKPLKSHSKKDTKALTEFHHQQEARDLKIKIDEVNKQLIANKVDKSLVMEEIDQPRENKMLMRGVFNSYGDKVDPGVPAILHPAKAPIKNRLDLAQWLVDDENPITARVVVNRWWAELFGRGLVSTVEDFGVKGALPSHPALLDWLAIDFMQSGWSMKHTIRTIVTSKTYQRASYITPTYLEKDDQNKWLARGPRFRLDAEAIRDNALAISGLIDVSLGGKPIQPPQPDGLWEKIGGEKYDYIVSPGTQQYRRGLYVVLKRGSPYPSFVNFDSSSRLACVVKRSRSNTPLQALTLLNDPVYVEAAQAFARRIVNDRPEGTPEDRINYAMQLALARTPRAAEMQTLIALYRTEKEMSNENQAWNAIATTLLNLDETITKE